ncbi:MAG TPA: hypothetical protein DDY78_04190 [Planctomycetales bacterium]|jgi:hypothetical protein|nr:hypothetical protein [Planctomycetales bacterium]
MNTESNTPQPVRYTADDLGGVPVTIDGPGDTTIRPRRAFIKVPANLPDPHAKPTLDDLSGIPVCFDEDDPPRPGQSRTDSDKLSAG